MHIHGRAGLWSLIVSSAFVLAMSTSARDPATFSFAHLTDPHLFDAGSESARDDNFAALRWSISEIDRADPPPTFVAVTGDLGIEGLIGGCERTHTSRSCPSAQQDAPPMTDAIRRELVAAAGELADEIRRSDVKVWLFVPGNNDVWQEKVSLPDAKVSHLEAYEQFLKALGGKLRGHVIRDLNQRWIQWGAYRFVGIDNSSFKNNDSRACAILNSRQQSATVGRLARWIAAGGDSFLYLLYHIPEVDDPYLHTAEAGEKFAGRSELRHPYSAWLVDDVSVRTVWQRNVVDHHRVKGLIAGHFHSPERAHYRSLAWAKGYSSSLYDKLLVSPPLAEKFQGDDRTARGFQIVTLRPDGSAQRAIRWYNGPRSGSSREAVCVTLLITLLFGGVAAHLLFESRRRRALADCRELNQKLRQMSPSGGP